MKDRQLAVVFETSHADTIGNACRIELVSYLGSAYRLVVYTNVPDFLRERMGPHRLVPLPDRASGRIPVLSDIMRWRTLASIVNRGDHEGVFMFHDTAPIALWLKKPCLQYVHQFGARSNQRGGVGRRLSRSIAERLVIAGLKRSRLNCVVSQPIVDLLRRRNVDHLVLVPHGVRIEDFQTPCLAGVPERLRELKKAG
ncbi:MAG: hypothetical protein MUC88_14995, partial [Planctomycetes bacterium]|nr:hypothetical protein [Planctomycetota bacterium]